MKRALSLPFQMSSLLFVAMLTVINAFIGGEPELKPVRMLALFIILSWLNKYAFALLDHAANGSREPPVASVEMLGPFGDGRAWIHPALVAFTVLAVVVFGTPITIAIAVTVAVLLPASMCAAIASPQMLDPFNPVIFARVIRGFGLRYLLLLGAGAVVIGSCYLLYGAPGPQFLRFAAAQFLVLSLYCLIGGTLYERRLELAFEPTASPERIAERQLAEHDSRRQQAIDDFYGAIRVREPARAAAGLQAWLASANGTRLALDVDAMIEQAGKWPEQRGLTTLLRTVIAHGLATRQSALALQAADAGTRQLPGFAPDSAAETESVVTLAKQAGRRRLAATLLDNFARTQPGGALPAPLAALRVDLPR
jgi:hypothetical protein